MGASIMLYNSILGQVHQGKLGSSMAEKLSRSEPQSGGCENVCRGDRLLYLVDSGPFIVTRASARELHSPGNTGNERNKTRRDHVCI